MVSLIIDMALALVAIIIIIRHIRLGFVKSILGSLKPIFAGVLAFVFRVPVAKLFTGLIGGFVNEWVYASISASAAGAEPSFDLVSLYNSCPIVYDKALVFFGLDNTNGFHESMVGIEQLDEAGVSALSSNISWSITWMLSLGIAMLVIFIVALIALTIVTTLLDMVTRLALLNIINRLLGGVVGLFWAIAFAFLVGAVLTLISAIVPNVVGENIINESIILGALARFNLFELLPFKTS
ncbi:MAG: CvpA family protein [Clostridia bacterium]|nr:CvpA family protein [Clostridia bacterium]